jgi:hypothetical protein
MKLASLIVSILMISALFLAGCSREKASEGSQQKIVVRKPITMPVEKENVQQPSSAVSSAPAPGVPGADETTMPVKEEKGVYLAKGDESLSKIAARKDVYGDPLKWILIYRFNREAFDKTAKDDTFPDKAVPAGTRLKIVPSSDMKKSSKADAGIHWVVNVSSFPQQEKIVRDAVSIVDSGYPAFITRATVKAKDYVRLRVGFFDDKSVAEMEALKIKTLLNISDLWTTKADEAEFKEFGGYK